MRAGRDARGASKMARVVAILDDTYGPRENAPSGDPLDGLVGTILSQARNGHVPAAALWTAAAFGIAAVLKSALAPAHGWRTEVMEAPTPVSALLHAGVVNAGGFLLIRFADVLLAAPGALLLWARLGTTLARRPAQTLRAQET